MPYLATRPISSTIQNVLEQLSRKEGLSGHENNLQVGKQVWPAVAEEQALGRGRLMKVKTILGAGATVQWVACLPAFG